MPRTILICTAAILTGLGVLPAGAEELRAYDTPTVYDVVGAAPKAGPVARSIKTLARASANEDGPPLPLRNPRFAPTARTQIAAAVWGIDREVGCRRFVPTAGMTIEVPCGD